LSWTARASAPSACNASALPPDVRAAMRACRERARHLWRRAPPCTCNGGPRLGQRSCGRARLACARAWSAT
jgi:hypothetical protein